jgi:hypothetical protein
LEEDIKRVKANPASDDFDFDVDAELAKLKAEVDKGDAFDSLLVQDQPMPPALRVIGRFDEEHTV